MAVTMYMFILDVAAIIDYVNSQTTPSCLYPSGCKNVSISDYPLPSKSPFYEQVLTATGDISDLDNACNTMFAFDNNTYLSIRSAVYKNGSSVIGRFIYSGVTAYPGVFKAQGARGSSGCKECFYTDYYLGSACDEVYVVYRCLEFGYCAREYSEQDNRLGLSTFRKPRVPSCCYPQIEALASSQSVLSGNSFYRMPNQMPFRCVTRFNGAPCINADSVAAGDSISLPDYSNCF